VNGGSDPRVLPAGQLVYIHDGTLLAVPFDNKRPDRDGRPGSRSWKASPKRRPRGRASLRSRRKERSPSGRERLRLAPPSTYSSGSTGKVMNSLFPPNPGRTPTRGSLPTVQRSPSGSDRRGERYLGVRSRERNAHAIDVRTGFRNTPCLDIGQQGRALQLESVRQFGAAVPTDIFRKAADGTGATEALTHGLEGGYPMGMSPDGKSLVFRRYNPSPGLYVLPLEPKGEAHALIADPKFSILNGEISPDGRWIAYDSTESGRLEVYVRPFPAVDSGRWQISAEGGSRPLWARSGREMFFLNAANRMIAVSVPAGPSFTYGKPEALFDFTPYFNAGSTGRMFDISPDGKRFLTAKPVGSGPAAARPSIVVVSHWFDEVKARMPARLRHGTIIAHAACPRNAPRPLPDRELHWRRWHGRSLQGPRHPP
jgi:hypothetical protein